MPTESRWKAWPFAVAIFLGAFLLFQVELIEGKLLLPWFGGTPAVWTTCLLFFQTLLVAGYGYAHAMSRRLGPRAGPCVHLTLLAVSIGVLAVLGARWSTPITPGAEWTPDDPAAPIPRILMILGLSIGIPFLMLSATSPLLAAWSARASPNSSPYRLYALSNAGSLAGLLSFPFLMEPALSLRTQAWVWCAAYLACAVACATCAVISVRVPAPPAPPEPPRSNRRGPPDDGTPPTKGRRLWWLALSAAGSVMLLATTNQICQDLAAAPFLWVLPLVIYLLSFILCFGSGRFYRRGPWTLILAISAIAIIYVLMHSLNVGLKAQVAAYALVLLASCMFCHGELAATKPNPTRLTSFYLTVAVGGATGAAVVAVAAPLLFVGFWEFQIGLWTVLLLVMMAAARDRASWLRRRFRQPKAAGGCAAIVLLAIGWALVRQVVNENPNRVSLQRNFYGVLSVESSRGGAPARALWHGRILHGWQATEDPWRRMPVCYYGERSGVGLAIERHPRRASPPGGDGSMRLGVIGLGVGAIASYARPGDTVRFYEINPLVRAMSEGPTPWFTYLKDCAGRVDVVMGDARLSLERELGRHEPQAFDVLAVDAFSSDSVPAHLLTQEAFEIYLQHLREPDGILAFHISNRFLDLRPLLLGLAGRYSMEAAVIRIERDEGPDRACTWVLVGRPGRMQKGALVDAAVPPASLPPPSRPWTDDWSNLLGALRRN